MEKITKYFEYCYPNDTTIEYVCSGLYSMLNCSFTSEDPAYGTDTIHYSAEPAKSMEQMAYEMLAEVKEFLDWKDGIREGTSFAIEKAYSDYSNSTLIAIEYALIDISKGYCPDKWYMTVRDAGRMMANRLLDDRNVVFSFCESDPQEAKGDPKDHEDNGGWHGVKRIDGFFDNEKEEFIVAIGHYGGGHVGFAYMDSESADYDSDYEDALVDAIVRATDMDYNDYIYVEVEKENK